MPITLSFLNKPRQIFLAVLLLTTLLKVWLAAAIPLTGDEAYFYQWGKHLDWGYYDHPPMGGWLLALMQTLSSAVLVLRLPAILLWIAVTFGMMDCLRRLQPNAGDKTWWMASLFLLMPFTWSLNLVTTDTPLIFPVFFRLRFSARRAGPRPALACGLRRAVGTGAAVKIFCRLDRDCLRGVFYFYCALMARHSQSVSDRTLHAALCGD